MSGGDELVELLGRAGLEVVGERRVEEVPPPPVVWRHVIGGQTVPTVAVADNRPDLVAELNAQWHRLASDAGILGDDGVFLIDFSGNQGRSWVRVRLTGDADAVPLEETVTVRAGGAGELTVVWSGGSEARVRLDGSGVEITAGD